MTGDPTAAGWLVTALYVSAAACCATAAAGAPTTGGLRAARWIGDRRFWIALTLLMLLLGANKQLDLQTSLTGMLRQMAREEQWYGRRRELQRLFVIAAAAATLLIVAAGTLALRGRHGAIKLAWAGAALLGGFILVRAASFHHADIFLRSSRLGARLHQQFEFGGAGLIAVAALGYARAAERVRRGTNRPTESTSH